MNTQRERFIISQTPPLPLEKLVLGRDAAEVAALLPQIFNLCCAAQLLAARLAMRLPTGKDAMQNLADDITRDHIFQLTLRLPLAFGLEPARTHANNTAFEVDLPQNGFCDPEAALDMLKSAPVIGDLLRHIDDLFDPGDAVAELPLPDHSRIMTRRACENSIAGRQASATLMQHIEQTRGRGPLWRVVARLLDFSAVRAGKLPAPVTAYETATVPAIRGAYTIRVELTEGRVSALERITPTDHMLAPGGIAEQALANLPAPKHYLANAVMAVLDPCAPVSLQREGCNA